MAVLSRLLFGTGKKLYGINGSVWKLLVKNNSYVIQNQGAIRCMSEHRTMDIAASNSDWRIIKNWMYFYFFLSAIPVFIIIFCSNVFVGPATIEKTPEGYIPKPWEYYRYPVTRFFARYFFPNIQMEYEKYLHKMQVAENKRRLRELEDQMAYLVATKGDHRYWSFRQNALRYVFRRREEADNSI
ncbi:NADH dehydrogenase [ubiquinone] 1 beta subcomplex subunit 5, mitochondrial [Eufriesea mexicana]|uniref:NADH dehydrogenase [ubiquinone] 1 beta subcomplex subunit 5, mitochondrial n=1 Tax=Eufriesea mexicana TaxID=516756 RepID=A0A310S811_9HYME|nr:PREDICTED: NADH dehydrogenase [ubiquinone] 1 beta subcomplex subunit 5, mitochondrial [Eufriesea mexicana]OAD54261.1 NADH dehydrogenase [ubiquinone] 1 beta subcomplex subunit 5, mitochondrial [Eufriesea mexicana]